MESLSDSTDKKPHIFLYTWNRSAIQDVPDCLFFNSLELSRIQLKTAEPFHVYRMPYPPNPGTAAPFNVLHKNCQRSKKFCCPTLDFYSCTLYFCSCNFYRCFRNFHKHFRNFHKRFRNFHKHSCKFCKCSGTLHKCFGTLRKCSGTLRKCFGTLYKCSGTVWTNTISSVD